MEKFFKIVTYRSNFIDEPMKLNVRVECCTVDDGKLPDFFDGMMDEVHSITMISVKRTDMGCDYEKVFFDVFIALFSALDEGSGELNGSALWTLSRFLEKVLNDQPKS